MTGRVLILGAHGRFGRNAADAFATAGWDVQRFDRARDDLRAAVQGMDVVVNAWNPPDYTTWARDMLPLHRRVIDALQGSEATLVVPGNVYVFGAGTPLPWGAGSAHAATNPLGRARIEMEAAYRASGLRTIILRGGDFLDTRASGNWFDLMLIKSLGKGRLTYPGPCDVPHAWAYLPDMARAAVALATRRADLPGFADIPFAGDTLTGDDMARHLSALTGRQITAKPMAWWPLRLAQPFMPNMRGLLEMRYLWSTPHRLDPAPLAEILPDFTPTPVRDALRAAIAHLDDAKPG